MRGYKQEKNLLRSPAPLFFLCLIYYVDMTEYDYSPEALERHLASQAMIREWVKSVDETRRLEQSPRNPFELPPFEENEHSQTPQSAFRATPQGDISPAYYRMPVHEHSQRYSSSQRSSAPSTPLAMPQARPHLGRSATNPPPSAGQFLPQASKPYAGPGYTHIPSRISSPYTSSRHSSQPQPPPMPHRSSSRNSFRSVHSPHIHASPIIPQQHGVNTYPYFSPSHHSHQQPVHQQPQHVIVVSGDRDFTVVPPPGHHIQFLVSFFFFNYHALFVGDSFYCLES